MSGDYGLTASIPGGEGGKCRVCDDGGWVCENHQGKPWEGTSSREDACHCGAGAPCWICNREMALAGPLHQARDIIKELMEQLDHGYPCGCSFPSDSCCAYTRAETYLDGREPTLNAGQSTAGNEGASRSHKKPSGMERNAGQ